MNLHNINFLTENVTRNKCYLIFLHHVKLNERNSSENEYGYA